MCAYIFEWLCPIRWSQNMENVENKNVYMKNPGGCAAARKASQRVSRKSSRKCSWKAWRKAEGFVRRPARLRRYANYCPKRMQQLTRKSLKHNLEGAEINPKSFTMEPRPLGRTLGHQVAF